MSKERKIKLPTPCRCVICSEAVTEAQPFIASKPRRGGLIVAHTECWEKEQRELREARKNANA
jgi:hypothetical protein